MLGRKAEQPGVESLLNSGEERGGQVVRRTCGVDWGLEWVSISNFYSDVILYRLFVDHRRMAYKYKKKNFTWEG